MQYITGGSDLLLTFDKEADLSTFDNRHLLVRMIVFRSDKKRLKAKAADHHSIANKHLPLNAVSRLFHRNPCPIEVLRDSVSGTVPIALVVRGHCRLPQLFVADSFEAG